MMKTPLLKRTANKSTFKEVGLLLILLLLVAIGCHHHQILQKEESVGVGKGSVAPPGGWISVDPQDAPVAPPGGWISVDGLAGGDHGRGMTLLQFDVKAPPSVLLPSEGGVRVMKKPALTLPIKPIDREMKKPALALPIKPLDREMPMKKPDESPQTHQFDPNSVEQLTDEKRALLPKFTGPQGLTAWDTMAAFHTPIKGQKNLFTFWGGPKPKPIIHAFFDSIYRNRGQFNFFLITDDNKQQYMSLPAESGAETKPIAPDHKTRQPADTHISWDVLNRVFSPVALPFATQKDFITNAMVAFFGGAYLDPSIIGKGKLDQYWQVMQDNEANYLNYALGSEPMNCEREGKKLVKHGGQQIITDKNKVGKWNGGLWLDVYFTMVFADAGIMKCWLRQISQDPEFGPSQKKKPDGRATQPNYSLYFIYGGDIFDSCFYSVYDRRFSPPIGGLPHGINLHNKREDEQVVVSPRSPGSPSQPKNGMMKLPKTASEAAVSTGRRLLAEQTPSLNLNFKGAETLCEGGCKELSFFLDEMQDRLDSGSPPPVDSGFIDPPPLDGESSLPFAYTGKGMIIDNNYASETMIINPWGIPQDRYLELAQEVYPNFEELLEKKHPVALMVHEAITSMNSREGGIYLKFYGTGESLGDLSWDQLCGPPISFAMYLMTEITGHNLCTGAPSALASVIPISQKPVQLQMSGSSSSASGGVPALNLPGPAAPPALAVKRLSKNVN